MADDVQVGKRGRDAHFPAGVERALACIVVDHADRTLAGLWLHGRPANTQQAYARDIQMFFRFVDRPLSRVTLELLQQWADGLTGATTTRARAIASVKSLIKFGHQLGLLPVDVGVPLRTPSHKNTIAERILPVEDIRKILRAEKNPRNAVLLRLMYVSGGRVSEICGLTWADCQPQAGGRGQVALFGKGEKTRFVLISKSPWALLQKIRPASADSLDPVFRSRKGGHLDPSSVWRIVKKAAKTAGFDAKLAISPHWFRHAHASHALDAGASIALVRDTLGHGSLATTSKYTHARPGQSSGEFLGA